jgi:hypothetical protein
MYEKLKSDGFLVETVFDGKGSILVRSPIAALALGVTAADEKKHTSGSKSEAESDQTAVVCGTKSVAPVRVGCIVSIDG